MTVIYLEGFKLEKIFQLYDELCTSILPVQINFQDNITYSVNCISTIHEGGR